MGWTLRDASGRIWPLGGMGTIPPGQDATMQRNGLPMSLDNGGDEIVLLDAQNMEQDRFRYTSSAEGLVLHTGHYSGFHLSEKT